MAHWLYCQNCQQWNKSEVPLSDDMSCNFCGNLFIKAKPKVNPHLEKEEPDQALAGQERLTDAEIDDSAELENESINKEEIVNDIKDQEEVNVHAGENQVPKASNAAELIEVDYTVNVVEIKEENQKTENPEADSSEVEQSQANESNPVSEKKRKDTLKQKVRRIRTPR